MSGFDVSDVLDKYEVGDVTDEIMALMKERDELKQKLEDYKALGVAGCKVCQEQRDQWRKLAYDAIANNQELCASLASKAAVVSAARALREVAQGTMILLGPTGLKFTAALDEYEEKCK